MNSTVNQTVNAAMQITAQRLGAVSKAMVSASGGAHRRAFTQWHDFSQPDHVKHLHVQYLEWQYGSVYRKRTRHILLLYNFDVAQTTLKSQHEAALAAFTSRVVQPHYIYATRLLGGKPYPRHFEDYANPFTANITAGQKRDLILQQPWAGGGSQDDGVGQQELARYVSEQSLEAPFDRYDTFFPLMDTSRELFPMTGNELGTFHTSGALYEEYQPFKIDKLFMLGPVSGSGAYPFSLIEGHASATGPESQNNSLSRERAEAVTTRLHALLNERCVAFDNVQPDLKQNVNAVGSNKPIRDEPGEVDENRSVKLVFETVYEGVHLLDGDAMRQRYDNGIAGVRNTVQASLAQGEAWLQALQNGQTYQLSGDWDKTEVEKAMRMTDLQFALASSALKFCQRYQGDFSSLDADSGLMANAPPWVNMGIFRYDEPGGTATTQSLLPIPFILQYGSYRESNGKYNLPVRPEDRLRVAAKPLSKYIYQYAAEAPASVDDVLWGKLTKLGEIYQQHHQSYFSKNAIVAHSFLMTELEDKAAFDQAVDNQEAKVQVSVQGQSRDVIIPFHVFVSEPMKERTPAGHYYWYDRDVLIHQVQKKATLAELVVNTHEVYRDVEWLLPSLSNEAIEASKRQLDLQPPFSSVDLYYFLNIPFLIGYAK